MEREILTDGSLESLQLIKEIDTLAIIYKADEMGKKKDALNIKIILIIMSIIFITFSLVSIYLCGFIWFLIIEGLIMWVTPIFLVTLIKKQYS